MRCLIVLAAFAAACWAQPSQVVIVPGSPPGGAGGACTDTAHGYLATTGVIYTCQSSTWKSQGGGGATPGGSNTQVQFNDANVFGGTSNFLFNKTSNRVQVAGALPSAIFGVGQTASSLGPDNNGYTDLFLWNVKNGTSIAAQLDFGAARGTDINSPSPVQNGDWIGVIDTYAWDGTDWGNTPRTYWVIVDGAVVAGNGVPMLTKIAAQPGDGSFNEWDLTVRATGQVEFPTLAFADIATMEGYVNAPKNGSMFYCSDCQVTTVAANVVSNATCKAGGGGSFAKRVNGAWKCEYMP